MSAPESPLILVVEDNRDMSDAMVRLLTLEGYRVVAAFDGTEALVQLRTGPTPAVVVLDLMMPNMNGAAFVGELAADPALKDVPVVVFSAAANLRLSHAVAGVVRKASDPQVLLDVIARLCRPQSTA